MLNIKLVQQCTAGNIAAVRRLISDNADVNAYIFGSCPLLAAMEANNAGLLDVLLRADVDIARFSRAYPTSLILETLQTP
jgi:hypothetical protein